MSNLLSLFSQIEIETEFCSLQAMSSKVRAGHILCARADKDVSESMKTNADFILFPYVPALDHGYGFGSMKRGPRAPFLFKITRYYDVDDILGVTYIKDGILNGSGLGPTTGTESSGTYCARTHAAI